MTDAVSVVDPRRRFCCSHGGGRALKRGQCRPCRCALALLATPLKKGKEGKSVIRTKHIKSGDWRTVESFFNAAGTAFFRAPSGAQIKVRYGVGFLGFDRQKQTLNGTGFKKLSVGFGSIASARMQVSVSQTTEVTYDVYGGGVAVTTPEIAF